MVGRLGPYTSASKMPTWVHEKKQHTQEKRQQTGTELEGAAADRVKLDRASAVRTAQLLDSKNTATEGLEVQHGCCRCCSSIQQWCCRMSGQRL
jgi:hypothetical protein